MLIWGKSLIEACLMLGESLGFSRIKMDLDFFLSYLRYIGIEM